MSPRQFVEEYEKTDVPRASGDELFTQHRKMG